MGSKTLARIQEEIYAEYYSPLPVGYEPDEELLNNPSTQYKDGEVIPRPSEMYKNAEK